MAWTDDILSNLNSAQREAVTHVDGPMLVVAGAGSGKTRVVTCRIAHLIARGVRPDRILALTFTNKAASEMKERIGALAGDVPRWVGTFHSACARLLRRDIEKLRDGRTSDFSIFDTDDQQKVIKNRVKALGIDRTTVNPAAVLAAISRAKRSMAGEDSQPADMPEDETTRRLHVAYEQRLRELNAVDFDDLLLLVVRLLEGDRALRDVYQNRFRYLLIDEYQDTNRMQYRLMQLLCGPDRNVHVTGDPDQSIYSWRGADDRNISDFLRDFPDARVVRLECNYRSTKRILHAANGLIGFNADRLEKELYTENMEGDRLKVVCVEHERAEADWVTTRVSELRTFGVDLSDMAVFYRTNAQSRSFEELLLRRSIPYQIVGGTRFYERREIKEILAHLRLLVNPRDVVSLERVTSCRPTGVGAKTFARLLDMANGLEQPVFTMLQREDFADLYGRRVPVRVAEFATWCRGLGQIPTTPVSACVADVLTHSTLVAWYLSRRGKDSTVQDRLENLDAFVDRANEYEQDHPDASLRDFLAEVALVADVDSWDDEADCLSLMTLHSAKGLEFPFVFIAGAEHGLLPHQNAVTPSQEQEERRLFYVGITRAQEAVAVTHACTRFRWGDRQRALPSCFLDELPEDAVECVDLSLPSEDYW